LCGCRKKNVGVQEEEVPLLLPALAITLVIVATVSSSSSSPLHLRFLPQSLRGKRTRERERGKRGVACFGKLILVSIEYVLECPCLESKLISHL